MPDKNNVKDGRLVRPGQRVPDKMRDRAAKEQILDALGDLEAGPGEPNIGELWQRLPVHRQREWFRHLYRLNPVVNHLVHKMVADRLTLVPLLPGEVRVAQQPEEPMARNGARFRVRCKCGRRISLYMHGDPQARWERRRVQCPECYTLYEFERTIGEYE